MDKQDKLLIVFFSVGILIGIAKIITQAHPPISYNEEEPKIKNIGSDSYQVYVSIQNPLNNTDKIGHLVFIYNSSEIKFKYVSNAAIPVFIGRNQSRILMQPYQLISNSTELKILFFVDNTEQRFLLKLPDINVTEAPL